MFVTSNGRIMPIETCLMGVITFEKVIPEIEKLMEWEPLYYDSYFSFTDAFSLLKSMKECWNREDSEAEYIVETLDELVRRGLCVRFIVSGNIPKTCFLFGDGSYLCYTSIDTFADLHILNTRPLVAFYLKELCDEIPVLFAPSQIDGEECCYPGWGIPDKYKCTMDSILFMGRKIDAIAGNKDYKVHCIPFSQKFWETF
jgi:hypothetical protein